MTTGNKRRTAPIHEPRLFLSYKGYLIKSCCATSSLVKVRDNQTRAETQNHDSFASGCRDLGMSPSQPQGHTGPVDSFPLARFEGLFRQVHSSVSTHILGDSSH